MNSEIQAGYLNRLGLPAFSVAIILLVTSAFQSGNRENSDSRDESAQAGSAGNVDVGETNLPSGDPFIPALAGVASYEMEIWDDPFKYRNRAREALEKRSASEKKPGSTSYTKVFDTFINSPTNNRLMIAPVIVDGGNTSAKVSQRTQTRHAVENALAVQGFTMDYPDRMSYVQVGPLKLSSSKDRNAMLLDTVVPIKLYKKRSVAGFDELAVVVLWIDRRWLNRAPVQVLSQIVATALQGKRKSVTEIRPQSFSMFDSPNWRKKASTAIVGPLYSGDLEKIKAELSRDFGAEADSESDTQLVNRVFNTEGGSRIFSPSATVYQWNEHWPEASPIQLVRTIGNNNDLVDTLVEELDRRWLLNAQTVLFTETGFSGPETLLQALIERLKNTDEIQVVKFPSGVGRYWSREIAIPEDQPDDVRDYLDRRMKRLQLGSDFTGLESRRVRLVGVLANNTEDKIEILRSARKVYPNAVFFTFDLDWRLFRDSCLPFTRNLIVASHYGLQADFIQPILPAELGDVRKESIAFRNGYDTSRYIAANIALKHFQLEDNLRKLDELKTFDERGDTFRETNWFKLWNPRDSDNTRQPLLFEIGYENVTDLTAVVRESRSWRSLLLLILGVSVCFFPLYYTIRPFSGALQSIDEKYMFRVTKKVVELVRRVFFPSVESVGATRASNDRLDRAAINRVYAFTLLNFLFLVFLAVVFNISDEPLLFSSGISCWPAVFIFYLIIVASIVKLWSRRRQIPWAVPQKFFPELTQMRKRNVRYSAFIEALRICSVENLNHAEDVEAEGLSGAQVDKQIEQLYFERRWNPFLFVALATIALLAVPICASIIMDNWRIIAPARGKLTISVATAMFYLSILLVFICTAKSLVQILALRRILSLRGKEDSWPLEWQIAHEVSEADEGVNTEEPEADIRKRPNIVDFMWWVATSTRQSNWALVFPSILLLMFAVALLPVFDGWPLKATMFYFIVFPFSICVAGAMITRWTARRLKADIVERLKSSRLAPLVYENADEEFVFDQENNPSLAADSSRLQDDDQRYRWTKLRIRESINEIEKIDVGAFGELFRDPILGSCILLATTLFTSQGSQAVTSVIRFLGL